MNQKNLNDFIRNIIIAFLFFILRFVCQVLISNIFICHSSDIHADFDWSRGFKKKKKKISEPDTAHYQISKSISTYKFCKKAKFLNNFFKFKKFKICSFLSFFLFLTFRIINILKLNNFFLNQKAELDLLNTNYITGESNKLISEQKLCVTLKTDNIM